ncbi:MAG: formate--tetrahydrofolate ligase, partial [Emcibacter sp.]|nr:formate--tetrahydrofolate ligase [Emcibacter sp.]
MSSNSYPSDIEIARAATAKPIEDIAKKIDIPSSALIRYGNDKAKVTYEHIDSLSDKQNGKLILVTAITPTPAG